MPIAGNLLAIIMQELAEVRKKKRKPNYDLEKVRRKNKCYLQSKHFIVGPWG
jgi:hypothetical protein